MFSSAFSALCADEMIIEDDVTIARFVLITNENHGIDPEHELNYCQQTLKTKPAKIRRGCWIGEKVCILPEVIIGEKSIIAASSVVTKNIPPYSMAMGVPAKVVKRYNFKTQSWDKCILEE